jgi:hypothetical protein
MVRLILIWMSAGLELCILCADPPKCGLGTFILGTFLLWVYALMRPKTHYRMLAYPRSANTVLVAVRRVLALWGVQPPPRRR